MVRAWCFPGSWWAHPAWRARKYSDGSLFLWQGRVAGSDTAPHQPGLLRPVCSPCRDMGHSRNPWITRNREINDSKPTSIKWMGCNLFNAHPDDLTNQNILHFTLRAENKALFYSISFLGLALLGNKQMPYLLVCHQLHLMSLSLSIACVWPLAPIFLFIFFKSLKVYRSDGTQFFQKSLHHVVFGFCW